MPITWRNVEAPSSAGAARTMEGATNTVNGAFDIFSKIIQQRQNIDQANVVAGEDYAKQGYLTNLQSAGTPEQLAAMEGSLKNEFASLPPSAQAAARGAFEARLASVRQNATATTTYNDGLAAKAEAPERAEFARLLSEGNTDGASAFLQMSGIKDKPALFNAVALTKATKATQERTKLLQDREDKTYALNSDEAARLRAEGVRQRTLDGVANNGIAEYQADTQARQAEVDPVFRAFDAKGVKDSDGRVLTVPRNKDGSVNYAAIGKNLRGAIENHLAENNSYTLDELAGSDTAARRRLTEALRTKGATPIDLARLEPVLAAGINTVPQALAGNDYAKAQRDQNVEDLAIAEASKQYVPLNDSAATATVAKTVFDAIDARFGADTWKAEAWRRQVDSFLKTGIEAKDEKGKPVIGQDKKPVKMIPSAETMIRLLGTVDTGAVPGFLGGSRWNANDLSTTLEDYLKDPEVYRSAGSAFNAGLVKGIRNIEPVAPVKPK